MQLVGMMDSPYVRRVAISMKLMGLPFEHQSISVFRQIEQFRQINPLVKVPTLVCDDGAILMDSTLILDYLDTLVTAERSLMPAEPHARRRALQHIGIALVAFEKAVQRFYELTLRPADKLHPPWLDRVTWQLVEAFDELEKIVPAAMPWLHGEHISQDDICIAVAWRFTQFVMPDAIDPARYPAMCHFSERAESLPAFISSPLE